VTIVDDLRALGLRAGDRVVVHSSLRAVGTVEGGANTVVDALLDVLGPEGVLMVPTFTYTTERFDPTVDPGRTGAVAETVRLRPGAVRSLHPTHSVAVLGPGARELCAGHEDLAATDVNSPLDRLARAGGYVLLLGVGHIANTTVHVAEFRANAPYLDVPPRPAWPRIHEIEAGGETRVVEYDRFPGCSRAFGVVERGLRDRSAIRDGRIGLAESQLMLGDALIEEAVTLLEGDAFALLCADASTHHRCTRVREKLSREAGARGRAAEAGLGG
jgi:aminoglycoside 3-N-acetyltransferase